MPKDEDAAPVYVSALNGTGLIAQDEALRGRLLMGANYSGGYDTNPNGLENAPKTGAFAFESLSGGAGQRTEPALCRAVPANLPPLIPRAATKAGSMHLASGNLAGRLNERWSWDAQALGRHGQDSIGMLAPQQSVPIGDVPGTGPTAMPTIRIRTPSPRERTRRPYLPGLGAGHPRIESRERVHDYDTLLGNSLIGTASASLHA